MTPALISVIITLAALAGVALTRRGARGALPGRPEDDGPLRDLDEAFASGEIDLGQYQARRARLRRSARSR